MVYPIATGLGAGYVPKGPGTAGSVVGTVLIWLLWPRLNLLGEGLVCLALVFIGVWVSTLVERDMGSHDPQTVVIDEIAGIGITFLGSGTSLMELALGFTLFRIFDIWKPHLIGRSGNLPEGWGVMADDVLAGMVAASIMFAYRWFTG